MLVDDDGERVDIMNDVDDFRDEQQIALQRSHDADFCDNGSVSTLLKRQSIDAKKLCIFDLKYKFKYNNKYDIGGTYTDNEPDLWFYYSTSICPGYNYLLNLFVIHRKPGNFSIGVSSSNNMSHTNRPDEISGWSILRRSLTWFTFRSSKANENYHIKTFCFTENDLKGLNNNILFIPISIIMNSSHSLNSDIIKGIKLQHDLSGLLCKKEKTDFILESKDGKKFPSHEIILAAHSPLLQKCIKESESKTLTLDINASDMELLLEFLYTGTIKDVFKQDCVNLIKIADKFKLNNLFLLAEFAISEHIDIENAIDIAILSQKYKLRQLQSKVMTFIKNNPKVRQTSGWKNLRDVEITKQLIEHIYSGGD